MGTVLGVPSRRQQTVLGAADALHRGPVPLQRGSHDVDVAPAGAASATVASGGSGRGHLDRAEQTALRASVD